MFSVAAKSIKNLATSIFSNSDTKQGAADIETRSQSLTLADPTMWSQFITGLSRAGVHVTPQSALSFSAVFACVHRIAYDIASLPFRVYRHGETGAIVDKSHDQYFLLNKRPHRFYSYMNYCVSMIFNYLLKGNAYALIKRTDTGRPYAYEVKNPDTIKPFITKMPNGEKELFYYDYENHEVILPEDIIHIADLTFDAVEGRSRISMARETIGMGIAAIDFGNDFYANSTMIGGYIENEKRLTPDKLSTIKNNFVKQYAGSGNSGKIAVLPEGSKFIKMGYTMPMTDAQYIQSLKFNVEQVCRLFGIQPHKIGHLEKSSFNNIEQQNIEYVENTLRPIVKIWEVEHDIKSLRISERTTHYFKKDLRALLRGDVKTRTEYYKAMFSMGYSIDEIRELEDMPRVEGGDVRFVPMNMVPLHKAEDFAQAIIDGKVNTGVNGGDDNKNKGLKSFKNIIRETGNEEEE